MHLPTVLKGWRREAGVEVWCWWCKFHRDCRVVSISIGGAVVEAIAVFVLGEVSGLDEFVQHLADRGGLDFRVLA